MICIHRGAQIGSRSTCGNCKEKDSLVYSCNCVDNTYQHCITIGTTKESAVTMYNIGDVKGDNPTPLNVLHCDHCPYIEFSDPRTKRAGSIYSIATPRQLLLMED